MNWRKTRDYRLWRVAVLRRDKVCVICGDVKDREAHHINHATYFPEMRYSLDNGVTLCRGCHTQFHTNFKNSFREKCTMKDFLNFKTLVSYLRSINGTNNK